MEIKLENINLFFDKIKTIGFWQRIFGWQQIKTLSYDAYSEFQELKAVFDSVSKNLEQFRGTNAVLNNDNEHFKIENSRLKAAQEDMSGKFDAASKEISILKTAVASKDEIIKATEKKISEQDKELALMKESLNRLEGDIAQLRQDNTIFRQTEVDRKAKYESDVASLNSIRIQIQKDRQEEVDKRHNDEIQRIQSMKEIWGKHEDRVKQSIKLICEKHTIEYLDKVPFKGSPDNTIKVCDEFIIFDAKSPASDDLQNFPIYIKSQTESVKKYIKEDKVRKDIFLVIPSNTVEVINSFCYNMADYRVYIVTLDVLEPLILTLKRIEEYEFVNQLSPEERENICRIIGKFAHMTKRRIQIDHFFTWEFLEILTKCQSALPREIIDKVIEFEKSEKLNPPQERRAKQILVKDLESDNEKTQKEAEAKGIVFPDNLPRNLKHLPLYESDKEQV